MTEYILIIPWVLSGVVAAGFVIGFFKGEFPGQQRYEHSRAVLVAAVFTGPIACVVAIMFLSVVQTKYHGWTLS